MTKLYKLSAPGWIKEYDNEADLKKELYSHICGSCRDGESFTNDDDETIFYWEPVNEESSIPDMLNTPCGCEYDIGEDEDRATHYKASERK